MPSELVLRNASAGRLHFTTRLAEAIRSVDILFLAVGTPSAGDGSADLGALHAAVEGVARHLPPEALVVIKSTVPVGTNEHVRRRLHELTNREYAVASNPEFLKEGAAVNDFMFPDRVVVGVNRFTDDESVSPELHRIDPALEREQIARLQAMRAARDEAKWTAAMDRLEAVARGSDNIVPAMIDRSLCPSRLPRFTFPPISPVSMVISATSSKFTGRSLSGFTMSFLIFSTEFLSSSLVLTRTSIFLSCHEYLVATSPLTLSTTWSAML